ncbi:MAG: FtsX-like permease family protein [Boseongicola sp. SB0675_bin_26]|nr:FtsX-like permease family protein [Boseongicola sp. SB0675_bin_26]
MIARGRRAILAANAREAVDSLRKASLRTILALVGVMIGISSVIAMVSVGEIAKEQARRQFEDLGTDILVIRDAAGSNASGIAFTDAMRLAETVPSIVEAAPRTSGYGAFRFSGRPVGQGSIQGVTRSFASVNGLSLREGRFVSDLDIDRQYCVIGHEVAEAMRAVRAGSLTGEVVEIDESLCTVVGVLDHKAESYALPVQVEANPSVFIPITTAQRLVQNSGVEVVVARSREGVHHEEAVDDVKSFFGGVSPDLDLDVITARELIAQMEAQMETFTLLLGAVGSISLVVGGIGIMNIMLVSVAERRTEIAIRRALGARRRDIRSQFLIESVILTMTGGALGVLLGLGATWTVCRFTGWAFLISWVSVASGLGTAAAVGLFFGLQPAHQASRLDPIAGLQGR